MTAPSRPVPTFATHGDFRDHVTGRPAECCPEAVAIASRCLTAAAQHMADLYVLGGSMAVAKAAYTGGKSLEELAAHYDWLIGQSAAAELSTRVGNAGDRSTKPRYRATLDGELLLRVS
jgi:hypothetical protein